MKQYTYKLDNLNCANCAAKIENKISQSDGFKSVSFNFATKKLSLCSEVNNPILKIQAICDSIEDGVTVKEMSENEDDITPEHKINTDGVMLAVSAVLAVAAFVMSLVFHETKSNVNILIAILSVAATVLSGYKIFRKGIKNAIRLKIDETVLLCIAVIAAFCLGEFVEAAMVTLLFSLGELIEDLAVGVSRSEIKKLAQIRPDTAVIIDNGVQKVVPAQSVKLGSTILVKPYERLPLDGIVVNGKSTLDNSALTGESMPVDIEQGSEVMSGAINGSGLIEIKTTKEYGNSTASRILQLVEEAAAQKGRREKLITRFASIYTPIILVIAVVIAVLPPVLGLGEFTQWLYRALVCLVASCPCAIVISVPLAYYSGIGAASKMGILIKGGRYLEALARADTFIFDKTGTLTNGTLQLEKIWTYDGFTEDEVLALAAACEKHSIHPVAYAIKNKANGLDLPQLSDYKETAGYGTSADYNGKVVECGGVKILDKYKITNRENASVFVVLDGKLIGELKVSDTVRDEAAGVISQLKKLSVKNTVMLTGDSKLNAEEVSKKLGVDKCYSNLLPSDKLATAQQIKSSSKSVCMVGDGINDAPVLSASDCGIAMGLGSEAAIEASDVVLSSGNLARLPDAVKLSRRVIRTVKTNIIFALAVKAAVIILAVLGIASMWLSVVADTGVSVICVLYAARLLKVKLK